MDVLRVEHVSKSFDKHKVVEDLTFCVPEHSIFGFVGRNGAGKTTTMKMVLGLLPVDEGEIFVCGERVTFGQTKTNRKIGFLPDVPEFYGYMRPKEYLQLCGDITGMARDKIRGRSEELLSLVGLGDADKKIGGFSRGMKQRLGIAQALLNEPKLLICDEPTSALDPLGRKEILDILREVKGRTTVIFSTHILSDVERICDRMAVLDKGRIVLSGGMQEMRVQHRTDQLLVEFLSVSDKECFLSKPGIGELMAGGEDYGIGVVFHTPDVVRAERLVIRTLADHEILPVRVEIMEASIEDLFLEVVQ